MTVMLLTAFAKLEGANYLKEVLAEPVAKILELVAHVEINPESLQRGEDGLSCLVFFFPLAAQFSSTLYSLPST